MYYLFNLSKFEKLVSNEYGEHSCYDGTFYTYLCRISEDINSSYPQIFLCFKEKPSLSKDNMFLNENKGEFAIAFDKHNCFVNTFIVDTTAEKFVNLDEENYFYEDFFSDFEDFPTKINQLFNECLVEKTKEEIQTFIQEKISKTFLA